MEYLPLSGPTQDATATPIKNVGGRPTKREQKNAKIAASLSKQTPEVLERLRQAFSIDATIEEASFYAGIHASTYYNWKKENPEPFEELERLRLTPILTARQTIVQGLKTADNARWYIERKRSDEFATKQKTEHSGKIETPTGKDDEAIKQLGLEYEEKLRQAIVEERLKQP